jgi:hypothetical protein
LAWLTSKKSKASRKIDAGTIHPQDASFFGRSIPSTGEQGRAGKGD